MQNHMKTMNYYHRLIEYKSDKTYGMNLIKIKHQSKLTAILKNH